MGFIADSVRNNLVLKYNGQLTMTEEQSRTKDRIIQACYFLTGALCLSIKEGYSYAPALLLLLSLPLVFNFKTYIALSRKSKLILASMLVYVLVQGISILWDGGKLREFNRPSRVLMEIAVFILCLKYPPRFLWLMTGVAAGAVGAGIHAIVDRFVVGDSRAFDAMNAIQGGDISMTLGLFSLCGVMWAIRKSDYRYTVFFTAATIMGTLGSILSQSRGSWLLLPVILFILYRIYNSWLSKKLKLRIGIAFCLLIALCMAPQSGIPQRFMDARHDIDIYFSGGAKDTSVGTRIELWKGALDSFTTKPLFGWGNHGVRAYQEQQYKNGIIAKSTYDFNGNAHNQYLDEMAKRGLIGLAALLALFLIPLYMFKKQLDVSTGPESKTLAACGIVHVLSTIGYCLSQAFLNQNSGIVFYCVFTAYFLSSNQLFDFNHVTTADNL